MTCRDDYRMNEPFEAKQLLLRFYDKDSDLFRLLWLHSRQVAEKALSVAEMFGDKVDRRFISEAALLHDIGIIRTYAPSIFCTGSQPYIKHGVIGAEMLRNISDDLNRHALVCERHTGSGLAAEEIEAAHLPLPVHDMLPLSLEEKIICYADKFFSKSSPDKIKTIENIRKDMSRFGEKQLARFNDLHRLFGHQS